MLLPLLQVGSLWTGALLPAVLAYRLPALSSQADAESLHAHIYKCTRRKAVCDSHLRLS